MSGIAERWKVLSGEDNWEGLLDPLDSDLRRYLIHYGNMNTPLGEAFINEPASKNVGLPRYARRNLLAMTGVEKATPFKYEVTKYFYAPSTLIDPMDDYNVRAARPDAVLAESNWIGYVAVATNDGKVGLGRRDILIVWRGTMRPLEWFQNAKWFFTKAPLIFGQDSESRVHRGWYQMYTTINQDPLLNAQSARDMIREEVERLINDPLYRGDEFSITVSGQSLGASLATLTAIDLAVNPIQPDILVTAFLFASPKVGDENFKNAFSNQQNLRGLRITDVNDFVPTLPYSGLPVDGPPFPEIFYQDVGVGFNIEAKNSELLKSGLGIWSWHDMNFYLHGIDGFRGSQGVFKPHGDFDITKLNKYRDALKDGNYVPAEWFNVKDKGMVQQDNGSYILDDHEVDETF